MEVVVTTGAISRAKLQSNHHHQQTNTHLFTGRMPFLSCRTTNSVRALKGNSVISHLIFLSYVSEWQKFVGKLFQSCGVATGKLWSPNRVRVNVIKNMCDAMPLVDSPEKGRCVDEFRIQHIAASCKLCVVLYLCSWVVGFCWSVLLNNISSNELCALFCLLTVTYIIISVV